MCKYFPCRGVGEIPEGTVPVCPSSSSSSAPAPAHYSQHWNAASRGLEGLDVHSRSLWPACGFSLSIRLCQPALEPARSPSCGVWDSPSPGSAGLQGQEGFGSGCAPGDVFRRPGWSGTAWFLFCPNFTAAALLGHILLVSSPKKPLYKAVSPFRRDPGSWVSWQVWVGAGAPLDAPKQPKQN